MTQLGDRRRRLHAARAGWIARITRWRGTSRRSGRAVHLVAHRVWPDLAALPGVTRHVGAAAVRLASARRAAARARPRRGVSRRLGPGTRCCSNGGNTRWMAHRPGSTTSMPPTRRGGGRPARAAVGRRRALPLLEATKRRPSRAAPAIICNSARDRRGRAALLRRRRGRASRSSTTASIAGKFSAVTDEARRDARRTLGIAGQTPIAVFVGALGDRRKGFDVLFDAWQRLCADTAWDANLVVVGVGAEADAWERRARTPGLTARDPFLRFRTDVARVLAAADVLVHPVPIRGLRPWRARGALPRPAGDRVGQRRRRRAVPAGSAAADAARPAGAPTIWRRALRGVARRYRRMARDAPALAGDTLRAPHLGSTWPRTSPRSSSEP